MPHADPKERKAYQRDYRAKHPEKWSYRQEYSRNRYATEPEFRERMRSRSLKRHYGITLERYEEMRLEQDNKCGICEEPFVGSPHTDHDHDTGVVRLLLCGNCNKGLGHFKDDSERLLKAAAYLERFK